MVHSQGGNFGLTAALNNPSLVKGLILVEPSGAPDENKVDISPLKDIPTLWVWGDYIDTLPFWENIYKRQETFRAALNKAGGKGDVLDLPKTGVKGNSHMLMMDKNSDDIAGAIQKWLVARGLTQ
jgi:pimeloyl-ACP methyl ester carboxylesterase